MPNRRNVHVPRSTDERQLAQLRLIASEGMTGDAVAERFGTTRSAVLGLVSRIRADDLAHSCGDGSEDPAVVAAAYVRGGVR